jgi:GTP-binding protein Era
LIDARKGLDDEARTIIGRLADQGHKKVCVINKIDLVPKESLLALADTLNQAAQFERIFMISATKGDGIGDVLRYFAAAVPAGPHHYPADEISDLPERLMAAEVTREKLYLRLHEELPYQSTVETDSWKELRDGSVRIEQTIFVERETQRKIVLGEGGRMIKAISMDARKELVATLDRKVHLFLHVKVREDWENDPERYRAAGLEFPKE